MTHVLKPAHHLEAYEGALVTSFVLLQSRDVIVWHSVAVRPERTASSLQGFRNHVIPMISYIILETIK